MRTRNRTILACVICLAVLSGCGFNSAESFDIHNVPIIKAEASSREAYYLAEDGTLYSPGADSDADCYVVYEDSKAGVVARNIKDFGTMSNGGFCIDRDGNLFMWNKAAQPAFNYPKAKTLAMIQTNASFAQYYNDELFYIDTDGNLFALSQNRLISENVAVFDSGIWLCEDGTLHQYGSEYTLPELEAGISDIKACGDKILLLADKNLYLCSDNGAKLLCEDVIAFDCSSSSAGYTVAAIDSEHDAYVWGRCLIGSRDGKPVFEQVEKMPVTSNVKAVHVDGSFLTFICSDNTTAVFRSEDPWGFCGNSSSGDFVGIENAPVKWVSKS